MAMDMEIKWPAIDAKSLTRTTEVFKAWAITLHNLSILDSGTLKTLSFRSRIKPSYFRISTGIQVHLW